MKTILAAGAAVALLSTLGAGAADAQGRGRNSITLYQLPNYQGASRTWTGSVDNLADQGFNDLAQSAKVEGRWKVCEDSKLRGRCVDLSGDVPDLAAMRMTVTISSFEDSSRGGGGFQGGNGGFNGGRPGGGFNDGQAGGFGQGPGGGFNGNIAGPNMDGRTASFFPRPNQGPYRNADDFCRRLGFSGVIYADDRGQDLRDVLCRR